MGLLLLAAPAAVQAQFVYATNNGAITLAEYTGSGGAVVISNFVTSIGTNAFVDQTSLTSVTIPGSVTNIGYNAFGLCTNLTSVTIPGSVTSIGEDAFEDCTRLTSVTIPNSVTSIGAYAFGACTGLTSLTIPGSVTNIGEYAFYYCTALTAITVNATNAFYSSVNGVLFDVTQSTLIEYPPEHIGGSYTIPSSVTSISEDAFYLCNGLNGLTSVTIPGSVTSIGAYAFVDSTRLTNVYFRGNAPTADSTVLSSDNNATVYYLPGTTGWSNTFAGRPTALWFLPNPLILNNGPSLGLQTDRFGFIISWATNTSVVVEASANLANPIWTPIQTNALTNGSFYFSEPLQTNLSGRFYRISLP